MSLLETRDLTAHYRDFQALFGVNTRLEEGDTLAIIGANGAGKSTFLKAVTGLLRGDPWSIVFDGEPIGALPAAQIMQRGIALVPEGRKLFPSLTVEENLQVGNYGRPASGPWNVGLGYVFIFCVKYSYGKYLLRV
jgi:branched-chain amino acid transport system ATP-binding protein